jgi:hypothetical protein
MAKVALRARGGNAAVTGGSSAWPSDCRVAGVFGAFDHALAQPAMTRSSRLLTDLLEKHDEGDGPGAVTEALHQLLVAAHVDRVIGAAWYERAAACSTHRAGDRDRALDTGLGMVSPEAPRLRQGGHIGGIPEHSCRRAELAAMIREAWLESASMRRVRRPGVDSGSKRRGAKLLKTLGGWEDGAG